MNCPKCKEEMHTRKIGSVEVDECAKCNSAWFEEDELRKCKDEAESDLQWMDFELWENQDRFEVSAKSMSCPKCDAKMAAIEYGESGVEVDVCLKCKGIWLDGGEFQKIIEALTEELDTKTAAEYMKASLEEAKEIITGPEGFISEWRDFLTVLRMLEYRVFAENPKVADTILGIQEKTSFL